MTDEMSHIHIIYARVDSSNDQLISYKKKITNVFFSDTYCIHRMIVKGYVKGLLLLFTSVIIIFYTYQSIDRYYSRLHNEKTVIEKPLKRPSKSAIINLIGTKQNLSKIKHIYVINLPYRQDRRTGMIALLHTLNVNASIVPAFNIHSPETVSRIHLTKNGPIRIIELASWLSHVQIWLEVAALNDDSWIIIFEDDIDLEMSTFDILETFSSNLWTEPDMIFLGYCGNPPGRLIERNKQGYRIHEALNPSCVHAYAIRRRSVEKILPLISPPLIVIDDAICALVSQKKVLVYSIHPPLAIQQSNTSSRPSDINPVQRSLTYKIRKGVNYLVERWKGVEFTDRLNNSALAYSDLNKANQWRIEHETKIWKSPPPN